MKKTCIIVDDEKSARKVLKKYILETPYLELLAEFTNAIDVFEFLEDNPVDIIFLDIEMPKLNGMYLAEIVQNKYHIIFTTAHREFALEGFELNARDYLLKPFSYERFLKAVSKVMTTNNPVEKKHKEHIFVKVDRVMMKVDFAELFYIEGASNYVKFHTSKGVKIVYDKLSDLQKKLPNYFRRAHKSFIINTSKVESYSKEFVLIDKKHIPVSDTYKDDLMVFLNE